MAEVNPAQYLQQRTDHTAQGDRLAISNIVGTPGVCGGAELKVTANGTPNMTVHVASGGALIMGTENANQGVYSVYNDNDVVLTVVTADPTNPRIDLVVARVKDAFYSGATNAWDLEIVKGTAAVSPSPPALPNNSYQLASLAVAAGTTTITNGNITDSRAQATATGAITVLNQPVVGIKIAYGSTTGTTNGSGDLAIVTGLTTVYGVVVYNGDGTARSNITWGRASAIGGSAGTFNVRAWLANTGAVINGLAIRYDWIAIGLP
jgi:hypothetical protein